MLNTQVLREPKVVLAADITFGQVHTPPLVMPSPSLLTEKDLIAVSIKSGIAAHHSCRLTVMVPVLFCTDFDSN